MTLLVSVFLEGHPRPQPRHHGKGRTAYVPSTEPVHGWREAVRLTVLNAWNLAGIPHAPTGPMALRLVFLMPRPRAHAKLDPLPDLHTVVPDLDNLEKAAKDALKGVCWRDDCQVAAVWKEKRWSAGPSGLVIEVHAIEDNTLRIPRNRLSRRA